MDFLDPGGALLDWSKTQTWEATVQQARKHAWDLCLMFPPCGTYSRARHRQDGKSGGPKPLRARGFLHGFPWLAKQHRAAVDHEDFVIAKCFNLITVLSELKVGWILVHPEDLGKMRGGETPASLWQWEEVQSILDNHTDVKSWVEHMCAYGAASAHPTRVLTNLSGGPDHMGLPRFDGEGWYLGPLGKCGHVHVSSVGRAEQEWTTKSSLPPQFLDELAVLAFERVRDDRATDHSFQGAEGFANWLLDQNRRLVQHEGEALCRLLPFEQPHVASDRGQPWPGPCILFRRILQRPFLRPSPELSVISAINQVLNCIASRCISWAGLQFRWPSSITLLRVCIRTAGMHHFLTCCSLLRAFSMVKYGVKLLPALRCVRCKVCRDGASCCPSPTRRKLCRRTKFFIRPSLGQETACCW